MAATGSPGHVQSDASQPRAKLPWVAQRIQVQPGLQGGFLSDVVRWLVAAQHTLGDPPHEWLMAHKEFAKCVAVAISGALDKVRVALAHWLGGLQLLVALGGRWVTRRAGNV
jgi:hypothetical protein